MLRGKSVIDKYKVLFLCRENAARSIIAEALLRELAGHRFEVFSAGAEPATRVHALALAQLRPGVSDLGLLAPKSWLEFNGEWAPHMDLIVTLDERVGEQVAPTFPGNPHFLKWDFADPLAEGLTHEERTQSFEKVFWQIVRRVTLFMNCPVTCCPPRHSHRLSGHSCAASTSSVPAERPARAATQDARASSDAPDMKNPQALQRG
jgi:arsenate reductase